MGLVQSRGPVQRVAVVELRRRTLLNQVAGEQHASARHRDDDIAVGVTQPVIRQHHRSVADIQRDGVVEHLVG